jgi:hypothetical protein
VITRELRPRLVDMSFITDPPGLALMIGDSPTVAPRTLTSWEGYELNVATADQQDGRGQTWLFDSWSDGGAAAHTLTTPAAATTYTAVFRPAWTGYIQFIPMVMR